MTRWLRILAEHYPSPIVSGVCHKAITHIEELEAALAESGCSDYFCKKMDRDCHACPVKLS